MLKVYSSFLVVFFLTSGLFAQTPCSLDNSFDTDGRLISDGSRITDRIIALPDGSAIVAYNPFGNGHVYIRHINLDGSIDNTYGTSGKTTIQVASLRTEVNAMLQLNNEVYLCGSTGTGSNTYPFITKLKSNGLVDASFGNAGLVDFQTYYTFNDMVFEPGTNKLIVTGMKGTTMATITRLHTSGFMDATFGNLGSTNISTGNSSTYYLIDDINIDQTGKYIITGKYYTTMGTSTFTQLTVMRFDANGALDNSFDTDGKAYYNSQTTGSHEEGRRIFSNAQNEYYICGASYVNGSNWNYAVLKIKNDGSTQNSFGTNGWKIYDLTNQGETETMLNAEMMSNGNLLLTGNQGSGDTVHFAMLMVKPDGSYDNNFAPNGLFMNIFGTNNNSSSAAVAITSTGKIYLGGYTRTCTGGTCGPLYSGIARYFGADFPTAINEVKTDNNIVLYPNPISSDGIFHLSNTNHESFNIHAMNMLGQEVVVKPLGNNSFQIKNAMKGNYLLRMVAEDGKFYAEKLLVE